MEPGGDSIILEEEIDPNYEPTDKEVHEYASWLGMDLESEQDLFWIAREGLKAPLPENWKPCKTTDTEEIYYFNFSSGQSTWDHPCDEYYRKVYEDHKKKRAGGAGDGDERKKKEKEDVAELLGKKGRKKKASTAKTSAEPLGPPVLARGAALGEKKPLPGLGGSKLNRLSSGSLGSASSLRPVASLGKLKGEAKNDRHADGDDEDDVEMERKASPRALSKPPLGSLLTKKPLSSTTSLPKAESKIELDDLASDFEAKKQKLVEEQTAMLRELSEDHEAKRSAQVKKHRKELEKLEEQEEIQLKQRRKELDKKLNDVESQFDKEESNLLRERKETLKRLEGEAELLLSTTKQELERDQQNEIQRLKSRLDTTIRELKDDHERQEKQLKDKRGELTTAAELAKENERLKADVHRAEQQDVEDKRQYETLKHAQEEAEKQFSAAIKQIQELQIQLHDAQDKLDRATESAPATSDAVECAACAYKLDRIERLQGELETQKQQLSASHQAAAEIHSQLEALQARLGAEKNPPSMDNSSSASEAELTTLRQVEQELRRELHETITKHTSATEELRSWRSKCSSLEKHNQQLLAAASEQQKQLDTSASSTPPPRASAEEMERLRNEAGDPHDQIAALTSTIAQINDQLRKEASENQQLREQLNNALADDSSRELSREVDQLQRETDQLRDEIAAKELEIRDAHEQLHAGKRAAEQGNRQLEADIVRLESENRKVVAESSLLNRQMNEQLSEASQAGDAAEQQAQATVTKQKWEIEQLQTTLKLATRDYQDLSVRVQQLEAEVDAAAQTTHQAKAERDSEIVRGTKKDSEREALQQKLSAVQEELESQLEKTRVASSENAEAKSQLQKLKFKEQATLDKLALVEDELKQFEIKTLAQQSEVERVTRQLRARSSQLDETTSAWRESQAEVEALSEQLMEAKRQLSEWRSRAQGSLSSAGGGHSGGELAELWLRTSELESKVDPLTPEKTQLVDKQRALAHKQLKDEASLRSAEAERDRLAGEARNAADEVAKWKDRLDKKTKELEQLKSELSAVTSEMELVEMALSKEKDEKRDLLTQRASLEKAKKQLDATVESLSTQLHELEASQGRAAIELQAQQSKLKRVENELDGVGRELRATQEERGLLEAKVKLQATELAALETRMRLLRSENNELSARVNASEDDTSRRSETIRRLEMQLDDKDARLRKESDEKESVAKQIAALRLEKEELETELIAWRRKHESAEARYKDQENAATRGDFQLKLRVQQLEAERDSAASGKDRLEQHVKSVDKELVHFKEELGIAKNDLEAARSRIKTLTLEKDDFEAALLQARTSHTAAARGLAYGTTADASSSSNATAEAMLVRLRLADVNKSELEQHLAEIASQLELATRRCAVAEARCRDQSVEIETLHVEIVSLRASMNKMHLSALETLPLVERLDYEHKKRTLKRDFNAQLRDFQEREEHALMRQKARVRAQHEKQIEELVDELDAKKQRSVEYEEQDTTQVLMQLRSERDAQVKELRQRVESDLLQEERTLMERKERRLEAAAAAARQHEDGEKARQRELRQALREEELTEKQLAGAGQGKDPLDNNADDSSPGQVRHARRPRIKRRASMDRTFAQDGPHSESESSDSGSERRGRQQRQTNSTRAREQRRRSHRREREIERWRQRLSEETTLLAKAKALVADKKKQLKRQADKIKKDKQAWKREWVVVDSGGTSGHRVAILQEMKAMIDHSASSWNTSMQQLRERDEWIQTCEVKLRRMRRALASLHATTNQSRSRSQNRSHGRGQSKGVRFDPVSSASDDSGDDNQAAVDSDAVLEKLSRLDMELASDASEFSADDRRGTIPSQSYAYPRDLYAANVLPATYRYPLESSYLSTEPFATGDAPAARLFRSPSQSARTASTSASTSSSRLSYARVWPSRLAALHRSVHSSDAAVQRRVARWALGRETMQHAATKQASWLTNLYAEVKAYGDTRAQTSAEAAGGGRPIDPHALAD